MLFESLSNLIGTGRGLKAALNAVEAADSFFRGHADKQACNALGITRAAAVELNGGNNAVLKQILIRSFHSTRKRLIRSFFKRNA